MAGYCIALSVGRECPTGQDSELKIPWMEAENENWKVFMLTLVLEKIWN
jgi:hypothetical protein